MIHNFPKIADFDPLRFASPVTPKTAESRIDSKLLYPAIQIYPEFPLKQRSVWKL